LPEGEIIRSLVGYAALILLGTDKGVRVCSTDSSGNLIIGPLIPANAVRTFEAQDRFVWFGWDNYDSTSSGLGRLDLSEFTGDLAPSYASDLMATAQGSVLSVLTFANKRVFAVSGAGIYTEVTAKVPSGMLDSGSVTYGITDPKLLLYADLRHATIAGTVEVAVSTEGGAFTSLGISSLGTSSTFGTNQQQGEFFEYRLTIGRSATDTTVGPSVRRLTLRAQPQPDRPKVFIVPLLLHRSVETRSGVPQVRIPRVDRLFLEDLLNSVVNYQEEGETHSLILEDLAWRPRMTDERPLDATNWSYEGTMTLRMKTVV